LCGSRTIFDEQRIPEKNIWRFITELEMPSLPLSLVEVIVVKDAVTDGMVAELVKRVNIPINSTTPPALQAAILQDPWSRSAKYGLAWVYLGLILLVVATAIRLYHLWGDKIRTATYKEEVINSAHTTTPDDAPSAMTDSSTRRFFPTNGPLLSEKDNLNVPNTTWRPLNKTIALFRWIFYRTTPVVRVAGLKFVFPSLSAIVLVFVGVTMSVLYCFLPQPLYYASMAFGSPPLAIRAGMMSVALIPWIVALATKANPISVMTGVSHERLIVLHRWGAWICIFLALIHAIPFWLQSTRDAAGFATYKLYFFQHWYIFTTGIAALGPLLFLGLHSLPVFRRMAYEFFVMLHIPVAWGFIGLMFWHCNNYLASWNYLYATLAIMVFSWIIRIFFLNWTNPFRASFLIGEESAITILPENAIKVTIPTQKRWRPGQYVYLRMPGISLFGNHPFTIASLCSADFPSEYGEEYRDMTLVFRPFGGFTRKVFDTAQRKGPYKTYRAFIDGPYGGMQRDMASFDQVIFFAGGSGITAIASQLLDLIKRMRDGKATTTSVKVVWALKRPELMEWFKEELRICRECAPPNSVQCNFFITAAKRYEENSGLTGKHLRNSGLSDRVADKINDTLQHVASKRNSALMMETELAKEERDNLTALPQAFLAPPKRSDVRPATQSHRLSTLSQAQSDASRHFDFGFPETPTNFQKNLMRFAFLPTSAKRDGWRTEYGRPEIPYMLKGFSKDFGRRTCVYVCGPPGMRTDVANTVAKLQSTIWSDKGKDEIFLHAENYGL
jgi:predicted ferric reductase